MPVISFSTGDILRSKVLEGEQWLSWQINNVSPMRPNDDKSGFNWDVTFTLIEAPNSDLNGKEIKRTFSTKANGFAVDLFLAAEGKKKDEVKEGFNGDTDSLMGKKIDGKVTVDVYNGQTNNRLEMYAPYKSMVGKGPAF